VVVATRHLYATSAAEPFKYIDGFAMARFAAKNL
jgi:hypothetical protein